MKKNLFLSLALVCTLCLTTSTALLASETSEESKDSAEETTDENVDNEIDFGPVYSGGITDLKATLSYSEAEKSGDGYKWNCEISAQYPSDKKVDTLRSSLQGSVKLRNSAIFNISQTEINEATNESEAWDTINSDTQYFESTDGEKELVQGTSITVTPAEDYKEDTLKLTSTAYVKLKGDPQSYSLSLGE